ncbi:MAG TPA: hypothetical protein PLH97_02850 [Verrucomicrobiota bacterium]|nr:hypothetical protein [Verrucomicrobiota bacterium]HPU55203.1 hypothetical protein [Verrucomicrobiota bacterium]
MSTLPENELDLEKLFLPAWAQEPPSAKSYAHYEGDTQPGERRGDRGPRRARRREGAPGGPGRKQQGRRPPRGEGGEGRAGERGRRTARFEQRREPPPPLPELNVAFAPEEKGVESLARQIKMTGRAYPLFDIARLILQKPERHFVTFSVKKKPDGTVAQPLFVCALDETLWLSEDEAIAHVLKKHFATFYQAERTATEPPRGKYTFVAQCGMSNVILGPPNHHDYQNQLRKLHASRFPRIPFEVFKSRVKIVRDEEIVKKWIEEQSWKTEYICLNTPESIRLPSREAVEQHFRATHKESIIRPVESHTLSGTAARNPGSTDIGRLLRQAWEDQRRFPLQIATVLSQQFASHGLQFFKVNKTITHVSVARPHFLDLETTPVSAGIRRIVEFINAHPKCTRRQVIEALAPTPVPSNAAPAPQVESSPAEPAPETGAAAAPAPVERPAQEDAPTPEQTAVIADLHWLIHQGHVIEFANGVMETAKKPAPKPQKQTPAPTAEASAETQPGAEQSESSPAAAPPASAGEPASETPAPREATPVAAPDVVSTPAPAESGVNSSPEAHSVAATPAAENSSAGDTAQQ